jgi:hypothetical protein
MALLPRRCPVPPREQAWTEKMLAWCVERMGDVPLRRPVVVPTAEFFPGTYLGTEQDVLRVVDRVRVLMGIDPGRVAVEVDSDGMVGDLDAMPVHRTRHAVVAGHYEQREGRGLIRIDPGQAGDPLRVIAVAAHELCHELLLGRGGVPGADGEDHEPLTDLLTVYTGFGVFGANAAFHFEAFNSGGWRTRTLGYLNVPMFGYALACYAWLRGEARRPGRLPGWADHLDANPHGYMRQGVRYLEDHGPAPALARYRSLIEG